MTVKFDCNCGQSIEVDGEVGQVFDCPCCNKELVVPSCTPPPFIKTNQLQNTSSSKKEPSFWELLMYGTNGRDHVYVETVSCYYCVIGNAELVVKNGNVGLYKCPLCGGLTKYTKTPPSLFFWFGF